MRVEELVRHQGLVGDVGVADQRGSGPRAEIQFGPHAPRRRRDIVIVEQVGGVRWGSTPSARCDLSIANPQAASLPPRGA